MNPEKQITVGQVLQSAVDRIMDQPLQKDGIVCDNSFRQFLATAGANYEMTVVNQLLTYEQAPDTDVYVTWLDVKTNRWDPIQNAKAFFLLEERTNHDEAYLALQPAWARTDIRALQAMGQKKWCLNPLYEMQEVEVLRQTYSIVTAETLPDALHQIAGSKFTHQIEMEEMYENFRRATGRVSVEEMRSYSFPPEGYKLESDAEIEAEMKWLQTILTNAVWVELMSRCSIRINDYLPQGKLQLSPYCTNEDALFFLLTTIWKAATGTFSIISKKLMPKYQDYLSFTQKYHYEFRGIEPIIPYQNYENEMRLPAITLPGSENDLAGYAMRRIDYLEEHEPERYLSYLSGDMLISHAMETAERACDSKKRITEQLVKQWKQENTDYLHTESLHEECSRQADHVVNEEIIFS